MNIYPPCNNNYSQENAKKAHIVIFVVSEIIVHLEKMSEKVAGVILLVGILASQHD